MIARQPGTITMQACIECPSCGLKWMTSGHGSLKGEWRYVKIDIESMVSQFDKHECSESICDQGEQ